MQQGKGLNLPCWNTAAAVQEVAANNQQGAKPNARGAAAHSSTATDYEDEAELAEDYDAPTAKTTGPASTSAFALLPPARCSHPAPSAGR